MKIVHKLFLNKIIIYVLIGLIGVILTAAYSLSTHFTKEITVEKTYTGVKGSGGKYSSIESQYMVIDTKGHIYEVTNSLWYMQWDASEEWAKLEKGKTYNVSGFGKRLGIMGMYPHIVRVH